MWINYELFWNVFKQDLKIYQFWSDESATTMFYSENQEGITKLFLIVIWLTRVPKLEKVVIYKRHNTKVSFLGGGGGVEATKMVCN